MGSLSPRVFKQWMDVYRKACENEDPRIAVELFTEDAEYHETPFDEPMIGRDAIHEYWSRASKAMKDVQFSYEVVAVDGNLSVALWQGSSVSLRSGQHVALDGVFLVEFDHEARCSRFREWWHRREMGESPFQGT